MYDNLPEGFTWETVAGRFKRPTVVSYRHVWVCAMSQRINDGSRFVYLDRHLERLDGPLSPRRDCQSYESGVVGCGLWVARHQDRLRREAGKIADIRDAKNQYGVPWTGVVPDLSGKNG